jgi:hypothetical protein
MLKTDSTLLIQIQLALIGIVVVAGLFYLWRSIVRLEEKVEHSVCTCKSLLSNNNLPFPFSMEENDNNDEISENDQVSAEKLMKHVFGGGDPTMMMFSSMPIYQSDMPSTTNVCVEDISDEPPPLEIIEIPQNQEGLENENDDDDENKTIVSIDTNPLSKSKLLKMNLEKIRHLCEERELSLDGSKNQLIEKLLGLSRE